MEKVFAQGIWFQNPRQNAPDFVKGSISFNVKEFVDFATRNQSDGKLNLDLKESKGGKLYLELNTYQKKSYTSPVNELNDLATNELPTIDLETGTVDPATIVPPVESLNDTKADIKPEDLPF